jgi:Ca2+/H+ antiporter, TMEM165/GDT1 family
VSGLLIAAIVFRNGGRRRAAGQPGPASLVLGTRYRPGGVFAGTAAAFAMHAMLAVASGSLLGLLPHKIVQIVVAAVFLIPAVGMSRLWPHVQSRLEACSARA